MEGYTQNANESLNALIWKYCPKVGNHGLITVNICVAIAVSLFNDGASSLGKIMEKTGLTVGKFCVAYFEVKDFERIRNAQRQAKLATDKERRARRRRRLQLEEQQEEA